MRCARLMLLGLGLSAALVATAGPAAPNLEVERWQAVLMAADANGDDRQAALTALGALAAEGPEESGTRDATFALAGYWLAAGEAPGALDRAASRVLSGIMLWPDDPRASRMLVHLATAQLERGDVFGAHISFKRLIEAEGAEARPEVLVRAAANAAKASDPAAAFQWSMRIDPEVLRADLVPRVHLTRLDAGQALGRLEVALESLKALGGSGDATLRRDPSALLAAGRTCEAAALVRDAIDYYVTFANLYTDTPEYAEVLLHVGRLHARVGELTLAESMLELLIEFEPETAAAQHARLELLELDSAPATAALSASYLAALREARDLATVKASCERFAERFIGSGLPEELMSALADLSEESGDSLAPLGARQCLRETLESVMTLLDSRDDYIAVAACAARAQTLGIPVPPSQRDALTRARMRLGLPPAARGLAGETVLLAREQMKSEDWTAAASTLRLVLTSAGTDRSLATEAMRFRAEALWRADREAEALAEIEKALKTGPEPPVARELRVLRADILFASGRVVDACVDYRTAAQQRETRWVVSQMERCSGESAPESSNGETS